MPLVQMSDVATVVADVLAWGAIHAGTGYIAHRLSAERFDHDTWLTRIRAIERSGRLYRALRVHRWKDRLPEAGAVFAGGTSKRSLGAPTRDGLVYFAALTRRAELAHWLAFAAAPVFLVWNRPWVGVVMITYGLFVNAPFIVIQRYNRLRIERALGRSSAAVRDAARARSARDTTGNNIPYGSPPNM
jgi:glycosyl-4,4'-diaponeurosporenoate acyltransferase